MKIIVNGKFFRTARLEAEYYEWLDEPHNFIAKAKKFGIKADLFTFLQGVDDIKPQYDFHLE